MSYIFECRGLKTEIDLNSFFRDNIFIIHHSSFIIHHSSFRMNLLQSIYCNQYYELKPQGKEKSARANGTGILSVTLVLLFFGVMALIIIIFPDVGDDLLDWLEDIFGKQSGRNIGRVVAILPFLVIYPAVRFTLGKEATYNTLITKFEALSPDEQKTVSNRGKNFFFITLGVVVVPFVIYAFSTLF